MEEANKPQGTPRPPGEFIRDELLRRSWSQDDLAHVLGTGKARMNKIINGTQELSPEIALALETAFGVSAQTWLEREAAHRLARTTTDTREVRRRARLYDLAPVKEMQKRGWIGPTESIEDLESHLAKFFGVSDLSEEPTLSVAMRKSAPDQKMTLAQRAWCFQVRALARANLASRYDESRLPSLVEKLRKLAAFPQESRKVPTLLAFYGIRFVVVEPLTGGGVDGVALWLDDQSPVIGMSIRYDRIDNFWFVLFHELEHIKHKDAFHVDSDPPEQSDAIKSEAESRANAGASSTLIPTDLMKSFVLRTSPLYSKEKINQFANRVKIHPGIIVGQLQNRKEIGYYSGREMLVKIRQTVTSTAITDGWGQTLSPEVL